MGRKVIEYMCTCCGKKEQKAEFAGRPMPGTCPRRGFNMPHRWVKNRVINCK